MTIITIYQEESKLAEILIEHRDNDTLTSRKQPVIASIDWAIKDEISKTNFLENLSDSKMLGGHDAPSFEELTETPNWIFPSLNDFLYMISSLDDFYTIETEGIPEYDLITETDMIPLL